MSNEQAKGDGAVAEPAGAVVDLEVTWGEQLFAPVQYQSFRNGSITLRARVVVKDSTTLVTAHAEMMRALEELSQAQFQRQLDVFLGNVRQAALAARGGKG